MDDKPTFILRPVHILVWENLNAFKQANGFSPQYKEVCAACKISRATLAGVYRDLEAIGAIRRQKMKERSIETIKHPKELRPF